MTHSSHATPDADPETLERVRQAELVISKLLRRGVAASLAVVVAGAILGAVRHPGYLLSSHALQRMTRPGAEFPHTLPAVLHGLAAFEGQAVIALGLLMLIATPVLRVAVSIVAFRTARDQTYTRITALVLFLLLLSFVLGKVE